MGFMPTEKIRQENRKPGLMISGFTDPTQPPVSVLSDQGKAGGLVHKTQEGGCCTRILTGKEVDDVTLLTALGFREEVSNLATPWVPPLESPLGPPGGATRVSFWETDGFFTAEPGTGRLAGCPVEAGCAPGSRFPEVELWTGVPTEELPEEIPCLEIEPAKGLFL